MNLHGMLIRDVTADDAEGVVGILNPIIAARIYTVFETTFTVEEERAYICKFPSRGVWKVAVREGDSQIIGFQVMEPFGPYTRAFDHVGTLGTYVALDQRRMGVAKALFAATLSTAREKGFEKVFTFVRADNPAALACYMSEGFTVIGTAVRHVKIDGHYIDEVLVEKALDF
jgi:L-amino acid N-acyltransferase YncA